MPENFTQYLIMILIGLLFAKDYLLPPLLKKLGIGNGNGKEDLKAIKTNHLPHLEEKMDKTLETQQEILSLLKEFKEYGIRIREDK